MKKYFVLLEDVKRSNGEIGYCDPIIEKGFDDEQTAHKFYESIDMEDRFNHLCEADKQDHYLEKSLVVFENWLDAGESSEVIKMETAGVDYLQKD